VLRTAPGHPDALYNLGVIALADKDWAAARKHFETAVASHPAQIMPAEWLIKEVRLTSSIAYVHEDFEIAKDLVATGRINVSKLHTSTSSLTDISKAFDKLADNPREVKILIDPRA